MQWRNTVIVVSVSCICMVIDANWLMWSWLSFANCGRSKSQYFSLFSLWGRFSYDFNTLWAKLKLHIQCPCNTHSTRFLNNSDSYVAFEHKKTLSCALVIRDCYYLPPLSQLRFLFTNEVTASCVVVLCSDQKCLNVSHEKLTLKFRSRFFSKIESKLIET